jgi:hypothetical protein
MAYTTKYRCEFKALPSPSLGISARFYRLDFEVKDYSGALTTLYQGEVPIKILTESSPDNIFNCIWGTKAEISLIAESGFDVESLYVNDDRQIRVTLYVDASGVGAAFPNVAWQGWVLPTELKEPYTVKPYPITLSASCGLSTLKARPFVDAEGKRLRGYVSLSTALRTAFAQTGLSLNMVTVDNLFEKEDMAPSVQINGKANKSFDPLYRTQVVAETFVNDKSETLTCEEAIKKIAEARPGSLRISQRNGEWWVIRTPELDGSWDVWTENPGPVRARRYTSSSPSSAPTEDFSETLTVPVFHHLPVQALDTPDVFAAPRVPGIRVAQDFGRSINRINGDWSSIDNTGLPTGWERKNMSSSEAFRQGAGTELQPYYMTLIGGGDQFFNPTMPCIKTTFPISYPNSIEAQRPIKRTLKFKFELHILRQCKVVVYAQQNNNKGALLLPDHSWNFTPAPKGQEGILTPHFQILNGQMVSKTGQAECSIEMDAIEGVISMTIYLCVGELLDVLDTDGRSLGPNLGTPDDRPYTKFYPLTLEEEREGINLDGTAITVSPKDYKVDTVSSVTLGDVPAAARGYDRVGTLLRLSDHSPTEKWFKANDSTRANGKTSIEHQALIRSRQALQSAPTWEGDLTGYLYGGFHSILLILDIGKPNETQLFIPYRLIFTRYEWNVIEFEYTVTAVRLALDDPAGGYPANTPYWQTPEGDVPLNEDETGTPVNPAEQKFVTARDKLLNGLQQAGIKPKLGISSALAGYEPIQPGKAKLTADVFNNGIKVGSVIAILRRQLDILSLLP